MEQYCKACLVKYEESVELLQYSEKNRRLFLYSTGLQVKKSDPIMFQICKLCFDIMLQACKFKKQCRKSDKKLQSFYIMKEAGDVQDLSMFLNNNEDSLSFRFHLNNSNTPMHKMRDDDNESTCTSIGNFMTDILRADQIPDTEARIIREMIEEEADVLDLSLDSQLLQDDNVSIASDFGFSPFSTPASRHTQQQPTPIYSPAYLGRPYEENKEMSMEHEAFVAAKRILLHNNPIKQEDSQNATEIHQVDIKEEEVIIKREIEDMDCNIVEEVDSLLIKENCIIKKEECEFINEADAIFTVVDNFNVTEEGLIEEGENCNVTNKESIIEEGENCIIKEKDRIDKNLENALRTEKEEYSLDSLLAITTPSIHSERSGASTPMINSLLFGHEIEAYNAKKTADDIVPALNQDMQVDGSECDFLQDFFNAETGEYTGKVNLTQEKEIFDDYEAPKFKVPLTEYVKNKFDITQLLCKICDKKFRTEKSLRMHFAKAHKVSIVEGKRKKETKTNMSCEKCGIMFHYLSNLRKHLKNQHQIKDERTEETEETKKITCAQCNLNFTSAAKLALHMQVHSGKLHKKSDKLFLCPMCGDGKSSKSNLRVHMRRHTKSYSHLCEECGAEFYTSYELLTHYRKHLNIRPFSCTQCERTFKRRDDLNQHLKVHTGDRPFQCDLCHKSFTRLPYLKKHLTAPCKIIQRPQKSKNDTDKLLDEILEENDLKESSSNQDHRKDTEKLLDEIIEGNQIHLETSSNQDHRKDDTEIGEIKQENEILDISDAYIKSPSPVAHIFVFPDQ